MNNYMITSEEHIKGKLKYMDDVDKYQSWNSFVHARNISTIWPELIKSAKVSECHTFYDYFFRSKGKLQYISAEVALLPRNRNGNLNKSDFTEDHPASARFLLYCLMEWPEATKFLEDFETIYHPNIHKFGVDTLGITATENQNVKYKTDKYGSMKVEKNIFERYEHIKFLPYKSNGGIISPINGYPYEIPEWYLGYEEHLKGGSLGSFI